MEVADTAGHALDRQNRENAVIPFRTTAPNPGSPNLTMGLIVANVAVFFVQQGQVGAQAVRFLYTYALVPAVYGHPEAARQLGLDPFNVLPILSNTFMHGGYLHLIVNMWTLWLFGGPLEDRLGRPRFFLLYLISGAAGSLGHLAFNLDSTVPALGASGAIAGLLGGFALTFPRAKVAVVQPIFIFPLILSVPAVLYTGVWFLIQVWQGTSQATGGGIAWWAHIGGFVAGLGVVWAFARSRRAGARGPWR